MDSGFGLGLVHFIIFGLQGGMVLTGLPAGGNTELAATRLQMLP